MPKKKKNTWTCYVPPSSWTIFCLAINLHDEFNVQLKKKKKNFVRLWLMLIKITFLFHVEKLGHHLFRQACQFLSKLRWLVVVRKSLTGQCNVIFLVRCLNISVRCNLMSLAFGAIKSHRCHTSSLQSCSIALVCGFFCIGAYWHCKIFKQGSVCIVTVATSGLPTKLNLAYFQTILARIRWSWYLDHQGDERRCCQKVLYCMVKLKVSLNPHKKNYQ